MKKLIAIGLLCVSNMFAADSLKYPLDIMADNPDLILFLNGQRVYRLVNPEPDLTLPEDLRGQHYLAMTSPEYTWSGMDVNQIPRFIAVHVKHSSPSMQHTIFERLLAQVPDSHSGFLKLNCLLETVRKNPHLAKLVFRYTMENVKQFGLIVGNEVMVHAPDWYMTYRAIVDDVAPEMANTFELNYVWLEQQYKDQYFLPKEPTTDLSRFTTQ